MMTLRKRLLKSSILGAHLAVNRWAWLRLALGRVASANGSTHRSWTAPRSVEYIAQVYCDYLACSGLTPAGKRILEIGPGDNLGVALRFLAAGAAEVVAIDKFYSQRDSQQERRIYLALRNTLSLAERKLFDDAVELSQGIRYNPARLRYVYGYGIEQAGELLDGASFDAIVSRAVLEELPCLDSVFSVLDRLLVSGGLQIHRVDLRDYGMFSRHGYHALEFLTVPDALYQYASKYSRPNRLRIDYYRRKMQELGYQSQLLVTRLCGVEAEIDPPRAALERGVDYHADQQAQIEAIRPRLLQRYRDLPSEDLLVAGMMLVARKP